MLLAIADGRQSLVLGPTRAQMGELMASLGADTALNLDGGGSTTLVARALGGLDPTVRNVPSDGSERFDRTASASSCGRATARCTGSW